MSQNNEDRLNFQGHPKLFNKGREVCSLFIEDHCHSHRMGQPVAVIPRPDGENWK